MRRRLRKFRIVGFTLPELLVSCALITSIGVALVILYRSASTEYEHSSAQMTLAQTARVVADKIIPYATTAVPATANSNLFIYSPLAGNNDANPANYPNIYCLDFCTGLDFLNPAAGSSFSSIPGSINPRGTGDHYRYRLRFITSGAGEGQLVLEKLNASHSNPNSSPTILANPARILGRNLRLVTFQRSGDAFNVHIRVSTITRTGQYLDGSVVKNSARLTRYKDSDSADRALRAKSFSMFTTVMIPYYTGK